MTKAANLTKEKLDALTRTLSGYWLLPDTNVIKVMLAGVVAHHFESDPLWIFLIAPPSSLKTELIASLDNLKEIHQISSLTPHTLFSGLKKTKGQQESNSILENIGDKILTLKDFTTVLSMRREDRSVVLSQLREIYDGRFDASYGSGVKINWKGRIGLIAGVTPIIDIHYSVFQLLGERFIQYRLPGVDESQLAERAVADLGGETNIRQRAKEAVKAYLESLEIPPIKEIKIPADIRTCLGNLASLVVRARSGVIRDSYSKDMSYIPEPEAPARLVKQLAILACGLAVLEGRRQVSIADYLLTLKVGLDCIPRQRMKVIEFMASVDKAWRTSEVAKGINYSPKSAKRHLEDLVAHELINVNVEHYPETWEFSERLSKYFKNMFPEKDKFKKFNSKKIGGIYKNVPKLVLCVPHTQGLKKIKALAPPVQMVPTEERTLDEVEEIFHAK